MKIRFLSLSLLTLLSYTPAVTPAVPFSGSSGQSSSASAPIVLGLGKTTATCIDKDGDGYGLGPGCANGPDADDNDPTVRTTSDVLTKYGSMRAFLNHHIQETLGNPNYTVRNIWYLDSTNGKDGRGKTNDESRPYRSFQAVARRFKSGDVVLFRAGTYPRMTPGIAVASGNPVVYMAYPGEVVKVDTWSYEAFNLINISGLVLDGFTIFSTYPRGGSECVSGGSWWSNPTTTGPPLFHDVIIQNFDCSQTSRGMLIQNGLLNLVIQDSVIHDMPYGTGTHPIYLGSRGAPSRNVIVRRNLIFNAGGEGNGFQFNGRVTNLVVDSNIIYNSEGAGISLVQGVSNSFITNNLIFNHANGGIKIMNYANDDPHLQAYDQTGNVIENNTVWQGTKDWHDGEDISSSPIYVFHASGLRTGNLTNNIFRNNILVTSLDSNAPAIDFRDASRPDELQTSTFQNNIVWSSTGTNIVAGNGSKKYDCAQLVAATANSSNCFNSNPLFADVNARYYNQPRKFNFILRTASPAIEAGTPTGAPNTDLKGAARRNPPSIGAYEYPK